MRGTFSARTFNLPAEDRVSVAARLRINSKEDQLIWINERSIKEALGFQPFAVGHARPEQPQVFRKILVPIDTAEPAVAEQGVFLAAQLAALTGAAVRMVHVLHQIPYSFKEFLPPRVIADRESAVACQFQDMARQANIPTERFSYAVRSGVVYDEVLSEAEGWGADLIIVGSHSLSMSTYLLGSNAQKIVRHANCSVLVVRPHKNQHGTYWLVPPIAS
jgi:nucleotide-binding universal stress UspA family protein